MNRFFALEGHSPLAHQFIGGNEECLMVFVPEGHSGGADRPGAGVPPGRTQGRVSGAPGMNSWAIRVCPSGTNTLSRQGILISFTGIGF